MDHMPVVILGASVRAAAFSAHRAGLAPWCVDVFADADLRRTFPTRHVPLDQYPDGLIDALADAPDVPRLYTGSLENRPDLVERLGHPLWGNGAAVLRRVRDPVRLARHLRERDIPYPDLRLGPPDDGRAWLVKPRRSAGGLGIRAYVGQAVDPKRAYLQERIGGDSYSAVFLGRRDGAAELLGVTRQLVGLDAFHADGFLYCGSIGPVGLDDRARGPWQRLGDVLAGEFRLRGLFGVDAVLRDGVPWPVEVNPRYTASVEVLERALRLPLLAFHRAAFHESITVGNFETPARGPVQGKAVLFARSDVTFPEAGPWTSSLNDPINDWPAFADIPGAGTCFEKGRPVLTLFAEAESVETCLARLEETARHLDRVLWPR